VHFYQSLCQTYGAAERLYLIQDNWPIHFHPDVLVALEPQHFLARWPRRLPPNWPTEPSARATRTWGALHLPIQLVPLPTYASWCNRIEKLWRKLHQDLLHLHPYANDLPALRQKVLAFLDQFAHVAQHVMQAKGVRRIHANHRGQVSLVVTCNFVSGLARQARDGRFAATVENIGMLA